MIKNSFPHLNPRQIAHLLDSFRPDEYLQLPPIFPLFLCAATV